MLLSVYKKLLKDKHWLTLTVTGLILLAVSFVFNFYAGQYANSEMSNPVTDIVLSHLSALDVDGLYVYGPMALVAFVVVLVFLKPQTIPFVSRSLALFILVRSIFISLTHIAIFPSHLVIDPPKIFSFFSGYGDLFFSGHTGLPFMMALIFWQNTKLRIFFLSAAVFLGAIVLLGHLHYSIDVLGAFFITYTVYHLALKFFKPDKALFDSEKI